jgi:CheY-like chemotaxis protein
MNQQNTRLQVLLVEDEPEELMQYVRDFPEVFRSRGIEAKIHPCEDFDDAFERTSNHRYDLIVSDTYKGPHGDRDARVLRMVDNYRGTRFCPLVIYSSGVKPPDLQEGAFVLWADKAKSGDIERAMNKLLDTNIPQLARQLHDDLDRTAGSYLWDFLEKQWQQLNEPSLLGARVLERMVRRRAAIQIGDVDPLSGTAGVAKRHAPEYYVYPAFEPSCFNLGDVLRSKQDSTDWRVILTPHCHLLKQSDQEKPRADHVLLVKAVKAEVVLGGKLDNARMLEDLTKKQKKLGRWAQSPAQTERRPEGRHWYLPSFLDIPHSFCDFMQVESISCEKVETDFERIATLISPYAEAMQSCFIGFYASVGLPDIQIESIMSLLA